ncbi:hypothetical protein DIPPA_25912 [Diplonema papillatum]|nr:hypothetical protein DIPPA_25912 [Diplonema papillatum]
MATVAYGDLDQKEVLVRGAEHAANGLAGLAVSLGYFEAGGRRRASLFPSQGSANDAARNRVVEVSGLLCRLVAQLSYWLLTDAIPFDNDPDTVKAPTTRAAQAARNTHEDSYVQGAHKAAGVAAAFSGVYRAGEGGASLLEYSEQNTARVFDLVSTAEDLFRDLADSDGSLGPAAMQALNYILHWAKNVVSYCQEVMGYANVLRVSPRDGPVAIGSRGPASANKDAPSPRSAPHDEWPTNADHWSEFRAFANGQPLHLHEQRQQGTSYVDHEGRHRASMGRGSSISPKTLHRLSVADVSPHRRRSSSLQVSTLSPSDAGSSVHSPEPAAPESSLKSARPCAQQDPTREPSTVPASASNDKGIAPLQNTNSVDHHEPPASSPGPHSARPSANSQTSSNVPVHASNGVKDEVLQTTVLIGNRAPPVNMPRGAPHASTEPPANSLSAGNDTQGDAAPARKAGAGGSRGARASLEPDQRPQRAPAAAAPASKTDAKHAAPQPPRQPAGTLRIQPSRGPGVPATKPQSLGQLSSVGASDPGRNPHYPAWAVPLPKCVTFAPRGTDAPARPAAPAAHASSRAQKQHTQTLLPMTESKMQELFRQYDPEGVGWISRTDMRDIWEYSDAPGIPQSANKLEEIMKKYCRNTGIVSYDEYSLIMFKLFSIPTVPRTRVPTTKPQSLGQLSSVGASYPGRNPHHQAWAVPLPKCVTFAPRGADASARPAAPAAHASSRAQKQYTQTLPMTESKMQELFRQYDPEGVGWISRTDMRDIWEYSDAAGIPQSANKLEEIMKKYCRNTGFVSYGEYDHPPPLGRRAATWLLTMPHGFRDLRDEMARLNTEVQIMATQRSLHDELAYDSPYRQSAPVSPQAHYSLSPQHHAGSFESTLSVTLPPGHPPGQPLIVGAPDGRQFTVIPPVLPPGSHFLVQVPERAALPIVRPVEDLSQITTASTVAHSMADRHIQTPLGVDLAEEVRSLQKENSRLSMRVEGLEEHRHRVRERRAQADAAEKSQDPLPSSREPDDSKKPQERDRDRAESEGYRERDREESQRELSPSRASYRRSRRSGRWDEHKPQASSYSPSHSEGRLNSPDGDRVYFMVRVSGSDQPHQCNLYPDEPLRNLLAQLPTQSEQGVLCTMNDKVLEDWRAAEEYDFHANRTVHLKYRLPMPARRAESGALSASGRSSRSSNPGSLARQRSGSYKRTNSQRAPVKQPPTLLETSIRGSRVPEPTPRVIPYEELKRSSSHHRQPSNKHLFHKEPVFKEAVPGSPGSTRYKVQFA